MAPSYKLSYFDFKGLAEPVRFLLKYGGIDFEDNRIPREQWPEMKHNAPFGQMPLLEFDGRTHHQSISICRYLGKQVKLAGNDDLENLQIDSIADTIVDFRQKIVALFYVQDEKEKAEKEKTLFAETIPFYLERIDKIAKENKGYLALGRLTWADLIFVAGLDTLNFTAKKDLIENYRNLKAVEAHVLALPAIKDWVAKRPKTDY